LKKEQFIEGMKNERKMSTNQVEYIRKLVKRAGVFDRKSESESEDAESFGIHGKELSSTVKGVLL